MYYIVGLGNPGEEYQNTRHNIGRMAVELLAHSHKQSWTFDSVAKAQKTKIEICREGAVLILPDTYMNNSGSAVAPLVWGEKISGAVSPEIKKKIEKKTAKMIVIQDDLDLPLGQIKIVFNRGSGGHRGIESIKRSLKTEAFIRIKIGILPLTPTGKIKKPSGEDKVVKFILGQFQADEMKQVKKIIAKVLEIVEVIIEKGVFEAMNTFNPA
jgi:peptidyl-tRNA hydrolase, PTH1 family